MKRISTNEALTVFARWEREGKAIALLLSSSTVAVWLRDGRFAPFTDDCLMISFAGDNELRIFLSEADFWKVDVSEIRKDILQKMQNFEQCVRIHAEKPPMQCFLYACAAGE
jgi:hypothetical protein